MLLFVFFIFAKALEKFYVILVVKFSFDLSLIQHHITTDRLVGMLIFKDNKIKLAD